MKTTVISISLIALLAILSSCKKDNDAKVKDIELTAKQQEIATSGNEFSLALLRSISATETNDNFMISPLSINYALAMTANGAKNNTLTQMLAVMDFAGYELSEFNEYFKYLMNELVEIDEDVELSIANSIWYKNNFTVLQSFLDDNVEYYNAEVSPLDFASPNAVSTINDWVSENTHGKITTILTEIPESAVMYLINAVYFYGTWKYEFDKSKTYDGTFYLSDDSQVETEMMKMETSLNYYSDGEVAVVELPYGQGNFVMDVLLPVDGLSVEDFAASLTSEKWTEITTGLVSNEIVLSMPKFKIEYEKELAPVLSEMGMSDLFIDGLADLSGINGTGGLFVSKVKHKTYIDVDEEGTEAAAVTSVEVELTSVNPDGPLYFTVSSPFVFIIRESTTGVILFTGIVKNP